VSEIAQEMGLSKVTIYNKINALQNDLKPYIRHKKGIQYIDDEGLLILKKACGLEVAGDILKEAAVSKAAEQDLSEGLKQFEIINKSLEGLKETINSDYIQSLKDQVEHLKQELNIKNDQLQAKDELLKNFQVMLQTEKQSRQLLEASREEREKKMDEFISTWRHDHKEHEEKKGFFKKLFR
jgi:DNA-binding phage protein